MTAVRTVPRFVLSGTSAEIGEQHGVKCRDRIARAIDTYRKILHVDGSEDAERSLLSRAAAFGRLIRAHYPDYALEIAGIAKGAQVEVDWIWALNARTELMPVEPASPATECTTAFLAGPAVLAQNWDWVQAMRELIVVLEIRRPGFPTILMMTEPGIIGKIGFNSAGLGVALNWLTCGQPLFGMPVHIRLRAFLDCTSLGQVEQIVAMFGRGTSSSITVAQGGSFLHYEFAGPRTYELHREPRSHSDAMVRTNHFLSAPINVRGDPAFASSFYRYDRSCEIVRDLRSRDALDEKGVEGLLLDCAAKSGTDLTVLREFKHSKALQQNIGTVVTVVMQLRSRTLRLRLNSGRNVDQGWDEFRIKQPQSNGLRAKL